MPDSETEIMPSNAEIESEHMDCVSEDNPVGASCVILRPRWRFRNMGVFFNSCLIRDLLSDHPVEAGMEFEFPVGSHAAKVCFCVAGVRPVKAKYTSSATTVVLVPALPEALSEPSLEVAPAHRKLSSAICCAVGPGVYIGDSIVPRPSVIVLAGQPGVGKSTAVATCATNAGAVLIRYSASHLSSKGVSREQQMLALERILNEARIAEPAVLLLDGAEAIFPPPIDQQDESAMHSLNAFACALRSTVNLEDFRVAVIVSVAPDVHVLHPALVQELADVVVRLEALPSLEDTSWAIRTALKSGPSRPDRSEIAIAAAARTSRGGTLAEVLRAVRGVSLHDSSSERLRDISLALRHVPDIRGETVLSISRDDQAATLSLDRSLWQSVLTMKYSSDDEVPSHPRRCRGHAGFDTVLNAVEEALRWPSERASTFARLGIRPYSGLLLFGPSGVGKTSMVRSAATASGASLIVLDASSLIQAEVGASEQALSAAYERASASEPSVVFLDEIDALFRDRSSRLAVTFGRLLDTTLARRRETGCGASIVTVGATNAPWLLPGTLLRAGRLERLVFVGPPDSKQRQSIGLWHASRAGLDNGDICRVVDMLGSPLHNGLSGADIEGAFRKAAVLCIAQQAPFRASVVLDTIASTEQSITSGVTETLANWTP